jgi:23S rRNA pseudouridine1911/1915/1917 synthase
MQVLYEDDISFVFYKPAGLLTIPTDKGQEQSLDRLVNQIYTIPGGVLPAHRLDRDTTGVILFAKGKANQDLLMQLFKEKKVKKQYVAFVHGRVEKKEGTIRIPIKDFFQRKFNRQMPAQSALTHYRVRDYYKDFTVVDVNPITGRTNQIRIHMHKIGHPIVGEDKYVFRKDFELRFRRTALHAASLEWPHPITHKIIRVEAELAADMQDFLKKHS